MAPARASLAAAAAAASAALLLAAAPSAAAAATAAAAPTPPPAAVAALEAALLGTLVTATVNGGAYANASAEWNARTAAAPWGVVFAAGDADVLAALSFGRTWSLPVAPRSGRHSVEGWSVCDGCLVLDVSAGYAHVALDEGARTVTVGAGASLGALLNATAPAGWLTPVGSCSTVGLAGYLLGGGIGWTSRLHGLAVDNLLSARLALPNGSVVTVTRPPPPEPPAPGSLAWALTGGGGGNFGVLLEATLALHPLQPTLLYAQYQFPWSAAGNATALYFSQWAEPRFDFFCLFVRPSTAAEPLVLLQGIWLGDVREGHAALAPLGALAAASNASGQASASVIETDYVTAHALFEGPLGARTANKQKSAFVPRGARVVSAGALGAIRAALLAAPPDVADNSAIYLNSMGGAVNAVDPAATAFPHRDYLANFVIDAHWMRNETTPAGLAWAAAAFAAMADGGYLTAGGGGGSGEPLPTYVNYLDAALPDGAWQAAYFGSRKRYQALQAVKTAVDPGGLLYASPQSVAPLPPVMTPPAAG
jgi:hypothetical protein